MAVSLGPYVALYDPVTNAMLQALTTPECQSITSAYFVGYDGRYLAAVGQFDVVLWDLVTQTGEQWIELSTVLMIYIIFFLSKSNGTMLARHPSRPLFLILKRRHSLCSSESLQSPPKPPRPPASSSSDPIHHFPPAPTQFPSDSTVSRGIPSPAPAPRPSKTRLRSASSVSPKRGVLSFSDLSYRLHRRKGRRRRRSSEVLPLIRRGGRSSRTYLESLRLRMCPSSRSLWRLRLLSNLGTGRVWRISSMLRHTLCRL